jgi:hypothetical protein
MCIYKYVYIEKYIYIDTYIFIYIYVCVLCAFVVLDSKLYKMHGTYIKIKTDYILHQTRGGKVLKSNKTMIIFKWICHTLLRNCLLSTLLEETWEEK